MAGNSELNPGHFLPRPTAGVTFEPRLSAVAGTIDDVIVAFPAGAPFLIGVEEEDHPVRVGRRGERTARLGVKIDMRRIAGDFHDGEVVATAGVDVATGALAELAVIIVEGVIGERGGDLAPRCKTAGKVDRGWGRGDGQDGVAFVTADAVDELIIVVVVVEPGDGLDVAAVLLIELVDEDDRLAGTAELTGGPFVPARDHHEWRIEFLGATELFGKIMALIYGAGRGVATAGVKAAPAGIAVAHVHDFTVGDAEVLGDGNVDLFSGFGVGVVAVDLRVGGFPVPGVLGVHLGERPVGFAQGEKLLHLGVGHRRIADQERLFLPAKPEIGVEAGLVEVFEEFIRGLAGLGVDHKTELRRAAAFAANLRPDLADFQVNLAVGFTVGGIENDGVDAGVGEERSMPPEHPRVHRVVIAVERLAPIILGARRAPERRVGLAQDLRIFGQNAGEVEAGIAASPLVPEKIKNAHGAVRAEAG